MPEAYRYPRCVACRHATTELHATEATKPPSFHRTMVCINLEVMKEWSRVTQIGILSIVCENERTELISSAPCGREGKLWEKSNE